MLMINSARESRDRDVARRRLLTGRRINLRFPSYLSSEVELNHLHIINEEQRINIYFIRYSVITIIT